MSLAPQEPWFAAWRKLRDRVYAGLNNSPRGSEREQTFRAVADEMDRISREMPEEHDAEGGKQ